MPSVKISASMDMINPNSYQDFARKQPNRTPQNTRPTSATKTRPASTAEQTNERPNERATSKKRPAAKVTFARSNSDQHLCRPRKPRFKPAPPKDDFDYEGLTNQMRKITFGRSRKWRLTSDGDEENGGKTASEKKTKSAKEDDKESVDEESQPVVDSQAMRRHRSSHYSKYRYPQAFHASLKGDSDRYQSLIPQCLRLNPRYCFLPVRQNCRYLPIGSVTHLKVHSIKSGCLPHPDLPGQITPRRGRRRRRPGSAPPSIAPTSNKPTRPLSGFNQKGSTSFFKSKTSGQTTAPKRPTPSTQQESLRGEPDDLEEAEDLERNGSYHYVYNRQNSIEVPVHDDDYDYDDADGDDKTGGGLHQREDSVLVEDFEPEEDASLDDYTPKEDPYFQSPPLSPPPRGPTRLGRRDSSPESIHTEPEGDQEDEQEKRKQIVRDILKSNEKHKRAEARKTARKKSVDSADQDSLDDAEQLNKKTNKNALQRLSSDEEEIEYEPDNESIYSRSFFA